MRTRRKSVRQVSRFSRVEVEAFEDRTLPSTSPWLMVEPPGLVNNPAAIDSNVNLPPGLVRAADNASGPKVPPGHAIAAANPGNNGIGPIVRNLTPGVNGNTPDANGRLLPQIIHEVLGRGNGHTKAPPSSGGPSDTINLPPGTQTPPLDVVNPSRGTQTPPSETVNPSQGTQTPPSETVNPSQGTKANTGPLLNASPISNSGAGVEETSTPPGIVVQGSDSRPIFLAANAAAVDHHTFTGPIQQPGNEALLEDAAGILLAESGMGGSNLFAANLSESQDFSAAILAPLFVGTEALLALMNPVPQMAFHAQGILSLRELPGFPALVDAEALAGAFEHFVEWASSDGVRDWLPWLCGAAMAAVAVDISRRQLQRKGKKEETPLYPELNTAGWLPEPAGESVPEPGRGF